MMKKKLLYSFLGLSLLLALAGMTGLARVDSGGAEGKPASGRTFSLVSEATGNIESDLNARAQELRSLGFSEEEIRQDLAHLRPALERSKYGIVETPSVSGDGNEVTANAQDGNLARASVVTPEIGAPSEIVSPETEPSTKDCVSGKALVGEFRNKVLAAEKRLLASGWVHNYTEEYYFQVAGKTLADGRPVPTHQVSDVWFLLGDYSPAKGALIMKMYSVSQTTNPAITHWAYETTDTLYDLSLGSVSSLDVPQTVRFYPDALDMMLRGELPACGEVQIGTWQGKKVFIFTKREQYGSPFTVGKGESALKLSGSGYRSYYDFSTGLPVGGEDFRLDADGQESLTRRVAERWERQEPSQEIVQQFQERLQEVER